MSRTFVNRKGAARDALVGLLVLLIVVAVAGLIVILALATHAPSWAPVAGAVELLLILFCVRIGQKIRRGKQHITVDDEQGEIVYACNDTQQRLAFDEVTEVNHHDRSALFASKLVLINSEGEKLEIDKATDDYLQLYWMLRQRVPAVRAQEDAIEMPAGLTMSQRLFLVAMFGPVAAILAAGLGIASVTDALAAGWSLFFAAGLAVTVVVMIRGGNPVRYVFDHDELRIESGERVRRRLDPGQLTAIRIGEMSFSGRPQYLLHLDFAGQQQSSFGPQRLQISPWTSGFPVEVLWAVLVRFYGDDGEVTAPFLWEGVASESGARESAISAAAAQPMQETASPSPLPASAAVEAPAEPDAQTALYSPATVGLATLLGTPIGGAVLMAMNFNRLGKPSAARTAVLATVAGLLALIGCAFAAALWEVPVPGGLFNGVGMAALVLMPVLTYQTQGQAIEKHHRSGGRKGSAWMAAAIGLLCGFATIASLLAVLLIPALAAGA